MTPHRLLMKKAYDTRIPLPHIRHFERKREIFFVCGQAKNVREWIAGSTALHATRKDGVSYRRLYEGKRKRETKKIPRLRSG